MEITKEDLIDIVQELTNYSIQTQKVLEGRWITYVESGVIVAALMTEVELKETEVFLCKYKSVFPGLVNPSEFPSKENNAIICVAGFVGNFKNSNVINAYTGFFEHDGGTILENHSVKISLVGKDQSIDNIEYVVKKALCYKPKISTDINYIKKHFVKMLFLT